MIGAGLAGMHYALQLLSMQPKLNIAMICKANLMECNSRYAQGGIAAVLDPLDSIQEHIQDTLSSERVYALNHMLNVLFNKVLKQFKIWNNIRFHLQKTLKVAFL